MVSGGAARRLRISAMSASPSTAASFRDQLLELIDGAGPECPMAADPALRIAERFLPQPELMHAPRDRPFDKACLLQNLEMLRDRGLRGAKFPAKLTGAALLPARKTDDHGAACAVGQSVKDAVQCRVLLHSHMAI